MQLVGRATVVGFGVGASAAFAYKYSKRSLLPSFMTDADTNTRAAAREAQSRELDGLLRQSAPAMAEAAKRAAAECGALDVSCRRERAAAQRSLADLKQRLRDASVAIAFGGQATADERDRYVAAHGCIAWTDEALATVAARGPLVEIGAGDGQWAAALRKHASADVVAYDDGSALPSSGKTAAATTAAAVTRLDGAAAAARHPDRALLLVAPPPGPQAARWLSAYKGDVVCYAGEGRAGAHANEEFFGALENGFRLAEKAETLRPFPGGAEKLYILERKVSLRGVASG